MTFALSNGVYPQFAPYGAAPAARARSRGLTDSSFPIAIQRLPHRLNISTLCQLLLVQWYARKVLSLEAIVLPRMSCPAVWLSSLTTFCWLQVAVCFGTRVLIFNRVYAHFAAKFQTLQRVHLAWFSRSIYCRVDTEVFLDCDDATKVREYQILVQGPKEGR